MTYAIGYLIYGLDATEASDPFQKAFFQALYQNPKDFETLLDIEASDFTEGDFDEIEEEYSEIFTEVLDLWTTYRGCDPVPIAFGVELGHFDETESLTLQELQKRAEVTQNHRIQYQQLLEKLPACLQQILPQPQVIIVWGSS